MAYFKASEEVQDAVFDVIDRLGLHNYIEFKILGTTKSKTLISVKKTSAITDAIANVNDCVTVIVYEAAFERISKEQQTLLIEDALNTVAYDTEKDKIVMGCPQIIVSTGGRQKYGDELINAAECGVLAIQQILDEEQQRKEEKKAQKKK